MDSENKIDILLSKIKTFLYCQFKDEGYCKGCINNSEPVTSDEDICIFSTCYEEILSDLAEEINNITKERDNALAALRRKITDEKIAALQMAIELDMNKYLKGDNNNEGM